MFKTVYYYSQFYFEPFNPFQIWLSLLLGHPVYYYLGTIATLTTTTSNSVQYSVPATFTLHFYFHIYGLVLWFMLC